MVLKQCCATGSLHTGTPTGRIERLHGLDCYVADAPSTPKGIIVIIPDAFGWTLPNNRILADDYAADGFQVISKTDRAAQFTVLTRTGVSARVHGRYLYSCRYDDQYEGHVGNGLLESD